MSDPRKPLNFLSGQLRAYHGSPYAFDKFDASKIGKGEGAQAYGYGHYFTDKEEIARGYRDKLSKGNLLVDDAPVSFSPFGPQSDTSVIDRFYRKLHDDARQNFHDNNSAIHPDDLNEALTGAYARARSHAGGDPVAHDTLGSLVESLRGRRVEYKPGGHMYDVNLGVNPQDLLNWDAPLSNQRHVWDRVDPSIRRYIDEAMEDRGDNGFSDALDGYTGRHLYNALKHPDVHDALPAELPRSSWLTGETTPKRHTADYLRSLDVPGIKYLDGFSRGAGEGTSNYVMFPGTEDLININRRYEQGGPVNTPTEGEGGLYAAPNSMFDTPPPYEWGYRPGGAHAHGGPVEMGGGGPLRKAAQKVRDALLGDLPEYKQGEETYLRYGKWPENERSNNFATGTREKGVSVYPLEHHGGTPLNWDDNGELDAHTFKYLRTADPMQKLLVRLQPDLEHPRFLVQGREVGEGHDGEPLLRGVSPLSRGWHRPQTNFGEPGGLSDWFRDFDHVPEFEGHYADGGPVEMATGGTTPTSTGGQYAPQESEGPGFFRNNDNYMNSYAGNINFVKNFVQSLSPAQREAQRLVSTATRNSGKEALVFGRGENPNDLAKLTQGTYENVSLPSNYAQYALQSADPFYSFHTHATNTLSPSAADLRIWGATQPGTIGLPYQSMFINASPQDSLLRIGEPGKWMDSDAQRIVQEVLNLKNKNEDLVANHGFMDPRMREFWKGNKLPDLAHTFHAESDQMPGVKNYLDKKIPGAAQGASMRDLYAGNFLQRIAELGIPVDVSAEHRIAGTPYLAQDVWPEFAAHVKKYALPKAEGGPVEMNTGGQYDAPQSGGYIRNNLEDMYAGPPDIGTLRKGRDLLLGKPKKPPRLPSEPAWDPARASALQYEIAGEGRGAGPLDLSASDQRIPDIVQEAIPRHDPARGVSPRMQDAINNPSVLYGIEDSIKNGMRIGADRWYHNNPIYQAFTRELGGEQGHTEFMKLMDYNSGSSPRSKVPDNIRNASYYYVNEGRDPRDWAAMPPNPAPYGHLAQDLHRGNADLVRLGEGDWGGYDVFKNPKPPSYGTNLGGNLEPVALDSHAFKNIGMRAWDPRFLATSLSDFLTVNPFSKDSLAGVSDDLAGRASFAQRYGTPNGRKDGKFRIDYAPQSLVNSGRLSMEDALARPALWDAKPRNNEYAAGEKLYQNMSRDMGLAPAEGQSAAWAGAGELTGLGTPADRTFSEMFNERVLLTAKLRGEDPQDTLRKLIRREAPLMAEGGTVEDQYHPIWQQSFQAGGQPESETRDYYTPKERAVIARQRNAERIGEIGTEAHSNPGGYWRDLLAQTGRGMASIAELPGLAGDLLNYRADYLDSAAPGSSPMRVPHWGTSEGISQGLDSAFPTPMTKNAAEAGRELGEMLPNMLGLGIASKAGRLSQGLGHLGNAANLASILGGGSGGDTEPTEWQAPPEPSYAYERFMHAHAPEHQTYSPSFRGYADGGSVEDQYHPIWSQNFKDGGGVHDILGMLGGLAGNLIPIPVLGPMLGKFAGHALGDLIEGGSGEIGDDAARDFTFGMADPDKQGWAGGGPVDDFTEPGMPSFGPGIPGFDVDMLPPNPQIARDRAERNSMLRQVQADSERGLAQQMKPKDSGGGGGGGMGDIMGMAMKMAPQIMSMMASHGGPVGHYADGGSIPAPNGEQPWMYGGGALMARGGYLRGCGGMNG